MNASEIAKFIGKRAHLEVEAGSAGKGRPMFVKVEVEILDGKSIFGRTDLKFRPVAGTGEGWASLEKLTIIQSKP